MAVGEEQGDMQGVHNQEASIQIGQKHISTPNDPQATPADINILDTENEADRLDKALNRIAFALERKAQNVTQSGSGHASTEHKEAVLESVAANLDMLISRVRTALAEVENTFPPATDIPHE